MKIAMIIDAWDPIVGGGQVHVKNICEKLILNHNCEIDLFVRTLKGDDGKIYNQDEVLLDGKWRVLRCGRPKEFFNFFERVFSIFSIFFRILKENKKRKYDLIHAHAFLGLLSGKITSFFLRKPIVGTVHGANLMDTNKKGLFYYIEKWLLTGIKYNLEISVSHKLLDYKNVNKNIVIISNGINVEEFDRVEIDKKYEGLNFLFVGRFDWQKGIDYLIKGISLIDKNILKEKKVKFNFIGYGYQENEYKNLVKQYNLDDIIIFKGKKTGEELIKEYKKNQVFILPSIAEGQPITVLEAMASKLPIIATDVGDNKYFISKDNGFLIKAGDEKEIKNIVEKVLEIDISTLEKLGENGYDLVSKNYTWDIMCEKTYSQYEKLKA